MGLFDKLKQAANFVTGGGATVQVTPLKGEFNRNESIKIKITAQVKDAPISVSNVYLEIKSKESVNVKKMINGKNETIHDEHTGFIHKVTVITSEQELNANQSYEWEAELSLPSNAQPTYHGSMCHHIWQIKAGLDVKGNDPDSGWIELLIR